MQLYLNVAGINVDSVSIDMTGFETSKEREAFIWREASQLCYKNEGILCAAGDKGFEVYVIYQSKGR